jgi:hypothetical protein
MRTCLFALIGACLLGCSSDPSSEPQETGSSAFGYGPPRPPLLFVASGSSQSPNPGCGTAALAEEAAEGNAAEVCSHRLQDALRVNDWTVTPEHGIDTTGPWCGYSAAAYFTCKDHAQATP